MKKFFLYLLLFISIFVIVLRFASQNINQVFNIKERAGIKIETIPKAKISIDNKEVGNSPFEDQNLVEGEYLVSLVADNPNSSSSAKWKGYVKLNPGTITILNRELAGPTNSSGEIITLEEGQGLTVTSNPTSAEVTLDSKYVGRTPLTLNNVSIGEHRVVVSRENYLKRSIGATTIKGYNLTINVDLALTEADLTITPTIPVSSTTVVIVKDTPTGFLRIRSNSNVTSSEVAQVKPGDTLILLEEQPNWDRIRTSDGKEGWVSSSYVEKKVN